MTTTCWSARVKQGFNRRLLLVRRTLRLSFRWSCSSWWSNVYFDWVDSLKGNSLNKRSFPSSTIRCPPECSCCDAILVFPDNIQAISISVALLLWRSLMIREISYPMGKACDNYILRAQCLQMIDRVKICIFQPVCYDSFSMLRVFNSWKWLWLSSVPWF